MRAEPAPASPVLVAAGLSKTYPGTQRPALANLDLEVAAGEVVGLLGPNGAGKTTAVSLLSSQLPPSAGRVRILGYDLASRARAARRRLGLVPQEIAVYPNLSARENLRFFGRMYGLRGADLEQRVASCLATVGLAARAADRVGTFSGGMKRRLNLAVGIVHAPAILFLDEPTVGIDAQSRNLILENLQAMCAAGTAMLYTTHYMEEAQSLCSRVVVLDRGVEIAAGAPEELVASVPGCADLGELFLHLTGRELRD